MSFLNPLHCCLKKPQAEKVSTGPPNQTRTILSNVNPVSKTPYKPGLLYKDGEQEIRVQGEFWEKVRNLKESEEGSTFGDLIEAGKGAWETVQEVMEAQEEDGEDSDASEHGSMLKTIIKDVFGAHAVDYVIKLGKELPWISTFVEIGSVIYLGIREVKENNENCERLGRAIQAVMMIVTNADKKRVEAMTAASDKLNQILKDGFEKYLSLGVVLMGRFTQRSNLMKFLMRTHDKNDFENIYKGLMSTVTLLNFSMTMLPPDLQAKMEQKDIKVENFAANLGEENQELQQKWKFATEEVKAKVRANNGDLEVASDQYSSQRKKAEQLISELGNGDTGEGLHLLSEYTKGLADGSRQPNEHYEYKIKQLKETLQTQNIDVQMQLQATSEEILNQLRSLSLPNKLSLQIKKFWADNFGAAKKSIEWEEFLRVVNKGYYTFLNSKEVKDKEAEIEVSLTRYVLKNMLDTNSDGLVPGNELLELYNWCNDKWNQEPSTSRGNPPRTIGDLIRTLFKYMEEACDYISEQQTLDFYDSAIDTNRVEERVFKSNEYKLVTIRVLKLSRNMFGDWGAKKVFWNIEKYMPNLRELEMEECRLEKPTGIQRVIPQLEVLLLGGNQFGNFYNKGLDLIVQGLQNKLSDEQGIILRVLDLSKNGITNASELVNILIDGDILLQELNLSTNRLDSNSVAAVESLRSVGITPYVNEQQPSQSPNQISFPIQVEIGGQ